MSDNEMDDIYSTNEIFIFLDRSLRRTSVKDPEWYDVFRLSKENSSYIVFIDEIDAIATKRFDARTGVIERCSISSSNC